MQSFANKEVEKTKFAEENRLFVESRKTAYKNEAYFYTGLIVLTQLMTLAVVLFGAVSIVKNSLDVVDLLIFALYRHFD